MNHYGEENSKLVFTRTLKQVPGLQTDFNRVWTLHILHCHSNSENFMDCCPISSLPNKVQDCVATHTGIGWMGFEGTEVRNEVLLYNTNNREYQVACEHDYHYVINNFFPTREEEEKIRRATEGALRSNIEMEMLSISKR